MEQQNESLFKDMSSISEKILNADAIIAIIGDNEKGKNLI